MNFNWSISCENLIGCCVANIDSSKFRVKKCHQTASPNCVNNLFVTNCFKIFLSPIFFFISRPFYASEVWFFEFFVLSRIFRLRFTIWKKVMVILCFSPVFLTAILWIVGMNSLGILVWNLWSISLWFFVISVEAISIQTSLFHWKYLKIK